VTTVTHNVPRWCHGALQIVASVYHTQEELAAGVLEVIIYGTTIVIKSPGLTATVALENYTFNFVANTIPTRVEVHFTCTFGVGDTSTGVSPRPC
jgi:hypothetical protein